VAHAEEDAAEDEERRRKQFRKATLTLLQSIRDHRSVPYISLFF
jgi:hypothetical protein